MSTYDEQFNDLEQLRESGTIAEFIAWVDSDDGQEWMDPTPDNWLIRRDTVRKAGFAVMRRSLGMEDSE